jgi:isopentenyl-diphosphate Delta-isomerase
MPSSARPGHIAQPKMADWSRADNHSDDVILIDDNDVAIGTAPKLEAHRSGLRHRAISIVVSDGNGRVLLQQRAAEKYHSGGLWTNTCCSHPRPGETVEEAAVRRLDEEMGIHCPLFFMFAMPYRAQVSNDLIEDEITHVFGGCFTGTPQPNPREVQDCRWMAFAEIERDVDRRPEIYTIWFRKMRNEFWNRVRASLSNSAA